MAPNKKSPTHAERLTDKSLKKTSARMAVLRILEGNEKAYSIQQIVDQLTENQEHTPDWATIYRILNQFEQSGLVASFDLGDGSKRYELLQDHSSHHHHVVCTRCKKIEHLRDCLDEKKLNEQVKKIGYSQITHRLDFFGICGDCQS